MEIENINSLEYDITQLQEQKVSDEILRIYMCSKISCTLESKTKNKIDWDRIAEKIIVNSPGVYKILCILGINKLYVKIMRGAYHE